MSISVEVAVDLYSFVIKSRPIGNNYAGDRMRTLVHMSGERGDDTGPWEASATSKLTLGLSSGYWQTDRDHASSGFSVIRFTRRKQPSPLRTLVTGDHYDWDIVLEIWDIMKWPLFIGETGSASTKADAAGYWRLGARGF